jgi:hypothetical protein
MGMKGKFSVHPKNSEKKMWMAGAISERRSAAAEEKAATHRLADGTTVHSFRTLLQDLSTIVRNSCRLREHEDAPTFTVTTTPSPQQRRAFDLLKRIA